MPRRDRCTYWGHSHGRASPGRIPCTLTTLAENSSRGPSFRSAKRRVTRTSSITRSAALSSDTKRLCGGGGPTLMTGEWAAKRLATGSSGAGPGRLRIPSLLGPASRRASMYVCTKRATTTSVMAVAGASSAVAHRSRTGSTGTAHRSRASLACPAKVVSVLGQRPDNSRGHGQPPPPALPPLLDAGPPRETSGRRGFLCV